MSRRDSRPARSHRDRLPHARRDMSSRHPHHVVLTFRAGAPEPRWRGVHRILVQQIRLVRERLDAAVSIACSMRDHVHLIVETRPGGANLGEALRFLNGKLALAINRVFGRRGPIYRDRYFSRPLKSLSELIRAIRYVALNPVKAKMVSRPEQHSSSAVRDYMVGLPADSPWHPRGWMFRKLGFHDDPRRPVVPRGGRQQRLPLAKGLPEHRAGARF